MGRVRHQQTAFIGGEINPLMSGRIDTEIYGVALAVCENWVPVNEGPMVKRPGFEYIRDAAPTATWFGTFRFSTAQEYVIEWSNARARFYTNGGRIETSPINPYEVVTPFAAAHTPHLSTQQSYDRLYIDHPNYPPGALRRTSGATFSWATSKLMNGPFLDQNKDEDKTVTVGGTLTVGGIATISSNTPLFAAGDVGSLFRIEAKDFSTIPAWMSDMADVPIGKIVRSDGKAYIALTAGNTGTVTPTHFEGAEWDGPNQDLKSDVDQNDFGVQWAFRHDRYGMVRITGFNSATSVTAEVLRRLPDSLTTVPTYRWAFGAFSTARGWPSIVVHWAGRQVHIKDFDIHASVAGDYGGGEVNFQTLTNSGIVAADLAFRRTLATEDPVLWAASDTKLLVGTAGKELAIGQLNSQQVVSGDNIDAKPQSYYGCEAVFPLQIGVDTVFVERGGRRLRSAGYDYSRDRFVPSDLTAAARQVTAGGIIQLAYQRIPYALLYAVRGDGQLAVHPHTKLDVKGFARTVLGGGAKVLSAVSVVGADNKTDELWVLVERQRADGLKREVWRQTAWRELDDDPVQSFFVDAGTKVTAAAGQTHFTGATHLAGEAIAVLLDGAVIPGITVAADGSFDLPPLVVPDAPYTLVFGLPFAAKAVTLEPAITANGVSTQGVRKRVVKIMLRLLQTFGIRVGGATGRIEELLGRQFEGHMDSASELFSGDASAQVDAGFDSSGRATFISDVPLPAIINAAVFNIEMDQRDV